MALDRARLEAREQVWVNHGRFHGANCGVWFTLDPPDEREQPDDVPECLAALGLPASATRRQVKSHFRKLSRQRHPDHGGDADSFRELVKNYEQALTMVEA